MKKTGLGAFLLVLFMTSNQASAKKSFQDVYISTISKIISNEDCFSEDLSLVKPTLLNDEGTGIKTYQTRFNTDIFVDFYESHGVINGAAITSSPSPKNTDDLSRFICISAAVQSAIDTSKDISDFKKLDTKKLSTLSPEGRNSYSSKAFEYEYLSSAAIGTLIRFDKKDE